MPYYDFDRHYSVRANSPKEAKVKFSRALENHEEDQYYVGTDFGFTRNVKSADTRKAGLASKLLPTLRWFLKGAISQIFGYPKYRKYKRY